MKNYFATIMLILLASCTTTKSSVAYKPVSSELALGITQNNAGDYVYCDLCPKPTLKVLDVEVDSTPANQSLSHNSDSTKQSKLNINNIVTDRGSKISNQEVVVQPEPLGLDKETNQIKTVFFKMDSYSVSNKDKMYLSHLKFNPNATVLITGYTDAYGGDVYNLALSKRRALSVYEILKIHNPNNKFQLISKGKCCYLTSSPFDPKNRRVEIVVKNK